MTGLSQKVRGETVFGPTSFSHFRTFICMSSPPRTLRNILQSFPQAYPTCVTEGEQGPFKDAGLAAFFSFSLDFGFRPIEANFFWERAFELPYVANF